MGHLWRNEHGEHVRGEPRAFDQNIGAWSVDYVYEMGQMFNAMQGPSTRT